MKNLIPIIFISVVATGFVYQSNQSPTIPLETELRVNITELDTFSTPYYFLYSFEYRKKTASFITPRTFEKLKMGKAQLTFSRVHEFKYDDNAAIRSGRGFIGEFNIFRPDSTELRLDFDEYSEHPTLKLKN